MCNFNQKTGFLLSKNRAVLFLLRFLPLIISLWIYADVGLDIWQTRLYYHYSYIGVKRCTANKYRDGDDDDEYSDIEDNKEDLYKISTYYFWMSLMTFFLPIFLGAILQYGMFGVYGIFADPKNTNASKVRTYIDSKPFWLRLIFVTLVVPIVTFIDGVIGHYIVVPISALYFDSKRALTGHLEPTERISIYDLSHVTPELISTTYLMENIGEAAPQIVLSITILVNHFSCQYLHKTVAKVDEQEIEIPILILSVIFSTGSFMAGTVRGFVHCKNFVRENNQHDRLQI